MQKPDGAQTMEQVDALRVEINLIKSQNGWSQEKICEEANISRKSFYDFMTIDQEKLGRVFANLSRFVKKNPIQGGFSGKEMYVTIAVGMNADTNNSSFISEYGGAYRLLRAHVPTMQPIISTLQIYAPKGDKTMICFKHTHVELDLPSRSKSHSVRPNSARVDPALIDPENHEPDQHDIVYRGFVFVRRPRAYLISTAKNTESIKEMIFNLPLINGGTLFRGIMLTVSADDLMPFAARLVVEKLPEKFDELPDTEKGYWKTGFRDWNEFPPEYMNDLFTLKQDRGLLLDRASRNESNEDHTQTARMR